MSGNIQLDGALIGDLNLDGTSSQTIDSNAAGYLTNLNVPSGADILLPTTLVLSTGSLTGSGTLTGSVQFGYGTYSPYYYSYYTNTISDAIFNLNGGTLYMYQPLDVVNVDVIDAANLEDESGMGVDRLNLSGNLTIGADLTGAFINLDGASAQTVTCSAAAYLQFLNVANSVPIDLPTTLILANYGELTGTGTIDGTIQFGQGNGEGYYNYFTGNLADAVLNLASGPFYLYQPLNVDTLNVTSSVDLESGGLYLYFSDQINVSGNLVVDAPVTGDAYVSLVGSTAQTITSSGTGYLSYLNIGEATVDLSGLLILDDGALAGSGIINGAVQFGLDDGNPYTSYFTGSIGEADLDLNGGTLILSEPLTADQADVLDPVILDDLLGNGSNPLDVTGNLTINAGVSGDGFINLVGSANQTISSNAGYVTNLNVANTGGNIVLATNLILQDGFLTGSGNFVSSGGSLQFGQGNNNFTTNFSGSIDNLVLDLNGTLTNDQTLYVNDTLTVLGTADIQNNPIIVAGTTTYSGPVGSTPSPTTFTWTGADSANSLDWSDPLNWSTSGGSDLTPQPGDSVIFNASSSQNSVIDMPFSISNLYENGYTGVISLGSQTLTVSNGFTITDAGTFNAGTGMVLFTGSETVDSADPLYNVTLDGSSNTLYFDESLNVVHSLTVLSEVNLNDDTSGNAPLKVSGNLTIDAPVRGNGFISLVGSGDQSITSSAGGFLQYLNVANAGNVDLPTTLVLAYGGITGTGTILGTVQFGLDNSYDFTSSFTGTIQDAVLNLGGGYLVLYAPLNVGTLEVISYVNLQYQPLDVTGDLMIDAPVANSGFVSLMGSGDQSITCSAAGYLTNLDVDNTGNVDLPTTLVVYNNGHLTGTGTFLGTVQFGVGQGYPLSSSFTGNIQDAVMNLGGATLNLNDPLNVGTLDVISSLNLVDLTGGAAPLDVTGNLTIDAPVTSYLPYGAPLADYGFISLVDSGDQSITCSPNGYLSYLNVANAGNVDLPTTLVLSYGDLTGTGTFVGTVQFGVDDGYNFITSSFTGTIQDAVMNLGGGTLYLNDPLNVDHLDVISSLNLVDLTGGAAPLDVTGNLTIDAPVTSYLPYDTPVADNGFISLVGSGDQTITSSVAGYLTNLNVANGGNVDLPTTLVLDNGNLAGTGTFLGSVQFGLNGDNNYSATFVGTIEDVVMNLGSGDLYLYKPLDVGTLEVISALYLQDQTGGASP